MRERKREKHWIWRDYRERKKIANVLVLIKLSLEFPLESDVHHRLFVVDDIRNEKRKWNKWLERPKTPLRYIQELEGNIFDSDNRGNDQFTWIVTNIIHFSILYFTFLDIHLMNGWWTCEKWEKDDSKDTSKLTRNRFIQIDQWIDWSSYLAIINIPATVASGTGCVLNRNWTFHPNLWRKTRKPTFRYSGLNLMEVQVHCLSQQLQR